LRKSDELSMGITCANNKDKLVGKIDYEISDSRKMVREVRYVIDYYGGSKDEGHSTFYIHTRPAIDGVRSMIDRLRLWLDRFLQ
jgi:hypothetical protein